MGGVTQPAAAPPPGAEPSAEPSAEPRALGTPARRLLVSAVLGVFAAVSIGLVVLESRQTGPPPPGTPSTSEDRRTAALTTTPDGRAWRAIVESPCEIGSTAAGAGNGRSVVERRPAGETSDEAWTPIEVPLAEVQRLSVGSDGSVVVAVGTDAGCEPDYAISLDGGFTWSGPPEEEPVEVTPSAGPSASPSPSPSTTLDAAATDGPLVDATAGTDGSLWVLVDPEEGPPQLRVGQITAPEEGADEPVGLLGQPHLVVCPYAAGEVAFLAAADARTGFVLCQSTDPLAQSLIKTTDGGLTWSQISGGALSPTRTLDGATSPVVAFDLPDGTSGHALLAPSASCDSGEMLVTADGGRTWSSAGCLGELAGVDRVLAVSLDAGGAGLLIGIEPDDADGGAGAVVVRTTSDGGRTWS